MEWIDITQRQPDKRQEVIVYCSDGSTEILVGVSEYPVSITHWIPVPPPPRQAEVMSTLIQDIYKSIAQITGIKP